MSTIVVMILSSHHTAERHAIRMCRGPASSLAPKQLQTGVDNALRFKAEFALQLLQRRGGAEGLHADDSSVGADISLPSQDRSLLDGDPRLHAYWQHPFSIRLRLVLEDVPGGHRDDTGANPSGRQRFV